MSTKNSIENLRQLVNEQAEDEGLWFIARTAPEAYLQQELRKLHQAIEQVEDEGLWFYAQTEPEAYLQQELRKLHGFIEEL